MQGVTRDDLEWWLAKVDAVEWTWAKTYAASAPHWYVVEGRTDGMTHEDYLRAARVIRRFGVPGKFYGHVNIYLTHGDRKWWTMDRRVEGTTLINMAATDQVYGPQDTPDTHSDHDSMFDSIAPDYDGLWLGPEALAANEAVRSLVAERFGAAAPSTLDVGCGTGRLLDLGITTPDAYTGVDPSQGMLNELVLKHPRVTRLYPRTADEFLAEVAPGPKSYDLVAALFGASSYLAPATIQRLAELAGRMVVLMNYTAEGTPSWHRGIEPPTFAGAREASRTLLNTHPGRLVTIGDFEVTVVEF